MSLMRVQGLTLRTPQRCLVEALEWQLNEGQRWCVIGRNGAGKSTLLRALCGLPCVGQRGEVQWLGRPCSQWPPLDAARVRAFQPQSQHDSFGLPVGRLLTLCAADEQADHQPLLAALDLAGLHDRDVRQLSGGERQRLALAQCAVQSARVMLLDEPVAFQDPAHQQMVARWLCSMPAQGMVMTAHDPNWVAQVATHVLALEVAGGWASGPVGELLQPRQLQSVYGCAWRCVEGAWLAV